MQFKSRCFDRCLWQDMSFRALDPEYPRGYRLLGTTHMCDASFGWSKSPQKSLTIAADLYHKVIQMDNSDTDCLSFLAYTYTLKGQH